MISTRLGPLYYTKVDESFLFNLTPLEHQWNTLREVERAMLGNRTLAIINASVTGSGKTLANYAYSLSHDPTPTIGIYPTNELIRDQERALVERGVDANKLIKLDSVELDEWQKLIEARAHAQVLHAITGSWMQETPVILTNPDILYLLMYNLYAYHRSFQGYRERVLHNIINNYPIIIFDEFHLYNIKQEANAAFIAANTARLAPEKPHIFIFSSATPDLSRLEHYLRRAGIETCRVHTPPTSAGALVCEPVNVEILPANLAHWQGRERIEQEFDDRLAHFLKQYPDARGVFILDSVYEAKLLAQSLADRRGFGWDQVGELHGYLDHDARRGALERRFTIGTTTIDVGVDFTGNQAKDFIVFEARSAEQFMQRLGRIGRQRREHQSIPNYALALVPDYVEKALKEKYAPLLQSATCSRVDFSAAIRDAYTSPNLFTGYLTKYAPLEATAAAKRIAKHATSDLQPDFASRLQKTVIDLFPRRDGSAPLFDSLSRRQWYVWKCFGDSKTQSWNINGKKVEREIIFFKELEQFRGSSDLSCAVYDRLDEKRGFFPFKLYHLPFVARRTQFREIEGSAFLEHLNQFKSHFPDKVEQFERSLKKQTVLNYVVVKELVDGEPQKLTFELDRVEAEDYQEQLYRFKSLKLHLQAPPPCSIENANEVIESINQRDGWLGWISERSPADLTRIHKLPPLFELFPLTVVGAGGGETTFWSLALGLSAIFMDSLPLWRTKSDRAMFA